MAILKKLLVASCILITSLTQAAMLMDADYTVLYLYAAKAEKELNNVADQLQWDAHGGLEMVYMGPWTGQSFADALYPKQKAALKTLLDELKSQDNNGATSKLFEHEVYRSWKCTFKNNYNDSIESNNDFAWAWLHIPARIAIHE